MIGNDLFKIESDVALSENTYRSLIVFYNPLVGPEALYLYQYLLLNSDKNSFVEINYLLNSLGMSIDKLEKLIRKLNEYKLVITLKDDNADKYVFVLNEPLSLVGFIDNNIFVRDFIQKTSGKYYQSVLSNIQFKNRYKNYSDVSYKLSKDILNKWTYEDEQYLKRPSPASYSYGNLFNINVFLNNVSTTLFPLKCRTKENLKLIADLADLYDISYQKMAGYLSEVIKYKDQVLDLGLLKYKCEHSVPEYRNVSPNEYNVPCITFLMNKQNAKSVTPSDRKLLATLSSDYSLKVEVINYLIEYVLNTNDNRLIGKFVYSLASDLNRNNIDTAEKAKEFLAKPLPTKRKSSGPIAKKPNYDEMDNSKFNSKDALRKRGNK